MNELFVPVWAAESFANDILAWTDANEIREICILAGIPVPHGPDDHKVFFVATEDYREHRLDGVGLPAMGNGFLDGVNSSLVVRGMDTPLQTGVLVTPVHPQAPDIEASIRLVDALKNVYEIDIDTSELEGFAAEIQRYYRELGERIKSVNQEEIPEDRMYM